VVSANNLSWSAKERQLLTDFTEVANKSLCLGPTTAATVSGVTQEMADTFRAVVTPLLALLEDPQGSFQASWYVHHADAIHTAVVNFAAAVDEVLEDLGYTV